MNDDPNRFSWMKSSLVKAIVFSGAVLLVLAFIILRYEGFFAACHAVADVFRPVLIGIVIAFLLNRPFSLLEVRLRRITAACRKSKQPAPKLSYGLALAVTYLTAGLLLTGLICILIPRIAESAGLFVDNFGSYAENLQHFLNRQKDAQAVEWIRNLNIEEKLMGLADYLPKMLEKTVNMTTGLINAVVDFTIGVVFSVYILADKRNLKRQAQGVTRILLKDKYPRFGRGMQLAVETFSAFATGQCLEAFFIGSFCFIGMNIFGFDYAPLISVMIGLTNVIPIVGPLLGTIPCAFMLLLVEPKQALWFVVFIVILQQLESNLLYPRVVGRSVGLPPLWVLTAVLVGGGFGGVLGMVIGVPLCSILYVFLNRRLEEEEAAAAADAAPPDGGVGA